MKQKLKVLRSKKLWITVLVIVLMAQTLMIVSLFQARQIDMEFNGLQGLKTLVYHGNQDTYRPVVVDAPSDRIYFPEMRFAVPYSHVSRDWQYSFTGDIGQRDSVVTITSRSMIDSFGNNNYKDAGNEFGGCSLLADVSFAGDPAETDDNTIIVALEDGRRLAITAYDDGSCQNPSAKKLIDQTIEQLKLAESY